MSSDGLIAQAPKKHLCSLVRRGESLENCNGLDCHHEHGKVYEFEEERDGKIIKKKYTCVKIPVSEAFPVWTNAVNRIMCQ